MVWKVYVNGSREALFALAQTVLDPTEPGGLVVCPHPFSQIYAGAALLGGDRARLNPAFAGTGRTEGMKG